MLQFWGADEQLSAEIQGGNRFEYHIQDQCNIRTPDSHPDPFSTQPALYDQYH